MKIRVIAGFVLCLLAASGCSQAQPEGAKASTKETTVTELDPSSFKTAVARGDAQLVDVRTPAEYAAGHLDGSVNIDWMAADYEAAFGDLDPKVPVLLYCQAGGRSEAALEYLIQKGYQAQHMAGGFEAWKSAGLPYVK